MSNSVPKGWEATSLRELCKFSGGSAFKEKYQGRRTGDYPFIKVSDMNIDGNQRFIINANHWIDQATKVEAKVKLFPTSAVVFAKVGAALLLNRRRILTRDTAIDNNMMAAIPNSDDNNFLYYVLQEVDLGEIVQGGAVPSVNQAQMEDVPALIPPLPEQQKIATILSSVDNVIETTRAQIDKLKDLKTGMMQELLAKGIGVEGAPHTAFKDSPVGQIPVGWDVAQIQDIALVVRGASPRPQGDPRFYGGNVPRLMVKDVTRDGKYVTPKIDSLTEAGAKLSRPMPAGTLTIVCSGTVGVPSFLNVNACIHDGFLALKDIATYCDAEFLYYQLLPMQKIFDSSATHGGIFTNLTTEILKEFTIVLPPLSEQKEIAKKLSALDEILKLRAMKLTSQQSTKKALMQDLLTGKVRVNVEEKEKEPVVA
jgi:type I restriction enzyme S subunit